MVTVFVQELSTAAAEIKDRMARIFIDGLSMFSRAWKPFAMLYPPDAGKFFGYRPPTNADDGMNRRWPSGSDRVTPSAVQATVQFRMYSSRGCRPLLNE